MSSVETKQLAEATKRACEEKIFGFSDKLCNKIKKDGVVPADSEEFMMSIVQACPKGFFLFKKRAKNPLFYFVCLCFRKFPLRFFSAERGG